MLYRSSTDTCILWRMWLRRSPIRGWHVVVIIGCALAAISRADTMTFSGLILQSTQDGTGPAVNNPSLNLVMDGDSYTVTLTFAGSIIPPNVFGPGLAFADTSRAAVENSFFLDSISVIANGAFDDFSLLGCLNTGSGCAFGNQLNANF